MPRIVRIMMKDLGENTYPPDLNTYQIEAILSIFKPIFYQKTRKMARFYVFLLVLAFSASCKKSTPAGKAEDKFYYLEFVDRDGTVISKRTIKAIKQKLIHRGGYYYGVKQHAGEWIRGIGFNDSVDVSNLDEHYISVHRFKDISEYDAADTDAEKIVITIHPINKDKLNNFNFRSYKKSAAAEGHKEWQPVFNPGNFRNEGPFEAREKDLGVWMSDLIVQLTFK